MSDAVDSLVVLCRAGARLESYNAKAETPLTAALNLACIDSMTMLQELGASKHSALHWAALNGFDAVVRDLLDMAKAPVDLLDDEKQTPLVSVNDTVDPALLSIPDASSKSFINAVFINSLF